MLASDRNLSIDAFRGWTIVLMILVNLPGSWVHAYNQLKHATWVGCTLTDLVWPFLLFIMGVSITYSLTRRFERGEPKTVLYKHIARRAGILILLGLIINAYNSSSLAALRFLGPLQRFGLTFFFAALIFMHVRAKGIAVISLAILIGYWLLLTLVPVPGHGAGILTPEGNLSGYLDRILLGVHGRAPTDPEGILSTMPALVSVLFGILYGNILRRPVAKKTLVIWTSIASWLLLGLGLAAHQVFPMIKSIYSPSFVLFTTGLALQFFAICYWTVELRGWVRLHKPAVIFSVNAIAAYFLHVMYAITIMRWIRIEGASGESSSLQSWLFDYVFAPTFGAINGSLFFALIHVLLWFAFFTILFRREIFVKV